MSLFKSKSEKELEAAVARVRMNMANNYKDAAQQDFADFEAMFDDLKSGHSLPAKVEAKYPEIEEELRSKMKGYTHQDQKPYWTKG